MHCPVYGIAKKSNLRDYMSLDDYEVFDRMNDFADYVQHPWNDAISKNDPHDLALTYIDELLEIIREIPGAKVNREELSFTFDDSEAVLKYATAQILKDVGEYLTRIQKALDEGAPIGHSLSMLRINELGGIEVLSDHGFIEHLWHWMEQVETGETYILKDIYDYHY